MPEKASPRYRITNLSQVVLYKLYEQYADGDSKVAFSVENVRDMFAANVSINLLRSSINLLRARSTRIGLVTRHGNTEKGYFYTINEDGIIAVEKALRQKNSLIAYFSQYGDSVLEEVAGLNTVFLTPEEREEEEGQWSPLPIDRSSDDYLETVRGIETAIRTIEQDNGFAVNHPNEREGILDSLREGLRWLKEKSPTKQMIFSTIVTPLKWIASTFGQTILGETAKETSKKVAAYIVSLLF
jgi:hypothetical protein